MNRAFKKVTEKQEGTVAGLRLQQSAQALCRKDGNLQHRAFPLFVDLAGKTVKVFGGGRIAARWVKTLRDFGCRVEIVSPLLQENLQELTEWFVWRKARYREGDAAGAALVLAATDERAVNSAIAKECERVGIPVSVADCAGECTFYFPAVVCKEDVTVGIAADGKDCVLAEYTAQQIRRLFTRVGKSD